MTLIMTKPLLNPIMCFPSQLYRHMPRTQTTQHAQPVLSVLHKTVLILYQTHEVGVNLATKDIGNTKEAIHEPERPLCPRTTSTVQAISATFFWTLAS